jgi:hypothetical protein
VRGSVVGSVLAQIKTGPSVTPGSHLLQFNSKDMMAGGMLQGYMIHNHLVFLVFGWLIYVYTMCDT